MQTGLSAAASHACPPVATRVLRTAVRSRDRQCTRLSAAHSSLRYHIAASLQHCALYRCNMQCCVVQGLDCGVRYAVQVCDYFDHEERTTKFLAAVEAHVRAADPILSDPIRSILSDPIRSYPMRCDAMRCDAIAYSAHTSNAPRCDLVALLHHGLLRCNGGGCRCL